MLIYSYVTQILYNGKLVELARWGSEGWDYLLNVFKKHCTILVLGGCFQCGLSFRLFHGERAVVMWAALWCQNGVRMLGWAGCQDADRRVGCIPSKDVRGKASVLAEMSGEWPRGRQITGNSEAWPCTSQMQWARHKVVELTGELGDVADSGSSLILAGMCLVQKNLRRQHGFHWWGMEIWWWAPKGMLGE